MPNRTTLNKFELFITEVRRVAKKRDLSREETTIKRKAMLVAALSSNHSWRTYKYFYSGEMFDPEIMLNEARNAFIEGWKNISENDVAEIVNMNLDHHKLALWLHFIMNNNDDRKECKMLIDGLKAELIDGLEPIERVLD